MNDFSNNCQCKEKHMKVLSLFSSQMLFAASGGIVYDLPGSCCKLFLLWSWLLKRTLISKNHIQYEQFSQSILRLPQRDSSIQRATNEDTGTFTYVTVYSQYEFEFQDNTLSWSNLVEPFSLVVDYAFSPEKCMLSHTERQVFVLQWVFEMCAVKNRMSKGIQSSRRQSVHTVSSHCGKTILFSSVAVSVQFSLWLHSRWEVCVFDLLGHSPNIFTLGTAVGAGARRGKGS